MIIGRMKNIMSRFILLVSICFSVSATATVTATPGYKAQVIGVLDQAQMQRLAEFNLRAVPTDVELDHFYALLDDMRRLDLRNVDENAAAEGVRVFGTLLGRALYTEALIDSELDPRKNPSGPDHEPEDALAVFAFGFDDVMYAESPFPLGNVELLLYWQRTDRRPKVQAAFTKAWAQVTAQLEILSVATWPKREYARRVIATLQFLLPEPSAIASFQRLIAIHHAVGNKQIVKELTNALSAETAKVNPLGFARVCGNLLSHPQVTPTLK